MILAGIGIRALIETVCKEKKATGRTLEEKIDSLASMRFLTKTSAEALHSMRIIGNAAAHEVAVHSEETFRIVLDVVEHLLLDVYILPKIATGLHTRPS